MVSVAKMKCNRQEKDRNEREKDRSYAMQAEIRASLCSLGAEKRQMMIQMQAEKVKKEDNGNSLCGCNCRDQRKGEAEDFTFK